MTRLLLFLQLLICIISLISAMDRESLRAYFNCEPCNGHECSDSPTNCMEYVKGPGVCNCCMVCARMEGEGCGVNTPRCAKGLECTPVNSDGPTANWNTFMLDKGVCRPRGRYSFVITSFVMKSSITVNFISGFSKWTAWRILIWSDTHLHS